MKFFPVDAPDDEIRAAVAEWSDLLAARRFDDALAMFMPAEPMTAAELEAWIWAYGAPDPFPDGRTFAVTPLGDLAERADIVASIDVNREDLFGLDPAGYLGMVHYDRVPLNGEASDLTARFHIKKAGADRMTLEFLDIHVM